MCIVHRLALVLGSRLMFDDGAVMEVEPARARNANSRRAARLRFLRPFTRRLARANTPANVRNRHVRVMNVQRRLETCDASQLRAADLDQPLAQAPLVLAQQHAAQLAESFGAVLEKPSNRRGLKLPANGGFKAPSGLEPLYEALQASA
jgi:hypothetical protein